MATRRINRPTSSAKRSRARAVPAVSDGEKGFYIAVLSFAVVLSALLAHGAVFRADVRPPAFEYRTVPAVSPVYGRAIYGQAMVLESRYDSRPYWKASRLTPGVPTSRATADLAIEHLIPCESAGRPINRIDTNGKMSYGILQFQDWPEWERVSGISGSPDNTDDAIRMAEWGIQNGMIDHWGCASILGIG